MWWAESVWRGGSSARGFGVARCFGPPRVKGRPPPPKGQGPNPFSYAFGAEALAALASLALSSFGRALPSAAGRTQPTFGAGA